VDILTAMKAGPLSRFQLVCVASCLLIITIDGFDVFVMGFVLPHLPDAFFASDAQRGYLLSAGLVGMAFGALFLSPLADWFGRRHLIFISLLLSTTGMLMSGFSENALQLSLWRLVTGIGVGSMATSLLILVQEYTPDRLRPVVFGIYATGFPLGSLLGGYTGVKIAATFGGAWEALFFFGAGLTFVAALLALLVMPESIDFLIARNPPGAEQQINRIARRLGNPDVDPRERPALPADEARHGTIGGLFADGMYQSTLLLWLAYAMLMITFYFTSTWTPQLVSNQTGSPDSGTTAGLILSLGGFIGSLLFSVLSISIAAGRLMWTTMVLAGLSVLGLAVLFSHSSLALVMTTALGIFLFVAITASATLVPPLYPAQSRVTATGWMVGIGRLCSITSPIAVGYLLAVVDGASIYALSAFPLFVGAMAIFMLLRLNEQKSPSQAGTQSPNGERQAWRET